MSHLAGGTLLLAALSACGGKEDPPAPAEPACLSELSLDCEVTFEPTFDAIFENRMGRTCGGGGRSCHASAGARAGLVLDEIEGAYAALLGLDEAAKPRVIPGDPECSLMMKRIESNDPDYQMPVGDKLPEGERCAIRQWIANGAAR